MRDSEHGNQTNLRAHALSALTDASGRRFPADLSITAGYLMGRV